MSFVNMMASDVWSSEDIDNKVHALIRYRVSAEDELKAARLARTATRSTDETAFIEYVDSTIATAVQEGRDARADMATLLQVLDVESAERRLAQPVVEPEYDDQGEIINQEAVDLDIEQRIEAQLVIDEASPEVMEWVDKRRPEPEPEELLID